MGGLILVVGIVAVGAMVLWAIAALSRKVGDTSRQLDQAREGNRRLADATEAEDLARRRDAAGGLYDDDGYRRD